MFNTDNNTHANNTTPTGATVELNWDNKPDGTISGLVGFMHWHDNQHQLRRVGVQTSHSNGIIYIYATTFESSGFMKAARSLYVAFETFVRWEPSRAHQARMLSNAYRGGRVVFFVSSPVRPPSFLVTQMAAREFLPVQFILLHGNVEGLSGADDAIDAMKPYTPSVADTELVSSWTRVPPDDCIRLNTRFVEALKADLAKVAFADLRRWQYEADAPRCGLFEDKFVIHWDGTQFVEATTLRPVISDAAKDSLEDALFRVEKGGGGSGGGGDRGGRREKASEKLRRARLNQ